MPTVLIVDDEEHIRYSLHKVFDGDKGEVLTAATAAEGLAMFRDRHPDVVILDLQLPDGSGLEVFREIHDFDPKRPVIFITAHGTTETAIEAMKGGAFDYLVKPLDLEHMNLVLDRALEAARLMNTPTTLPDETDGDRIVGRSKVMQEMCKLIGRIAPQDVNVLILGESGTGKELVARALYQHSRRAGRPFMAINCAAIPETLLESELFGHEKGAFTGAERRRIGKFEQCNDGTLFFDEIGDMSLSVQVKLLRVLQEQRFERLGSNETVQTRVRVLAATNQDLDVLVKEGRFRTDLYYRLKMVSLRVPPLRDRLDDVPELAHYFMFRFNRELGSQLRTFAPRTLEMLQSCTWPGNVRELQGVLKQAMLKASGHVLLPDFLPESLAAPLPNGEAPLPASRFDLEGLIESLLEKGESHIHQKVIEPVERLLLSRVLRQTHGHQAHASEMLGLHRATLRQKLRALGMAVDKVLVDDGGEEAHPPTAKSQQ